MCEGPSLEYLLIRILLIHHTLYTTLRPYTPTPHSSTLFAAAVLAGKKRGRPRTNPLPILTAAHLMSHNNNNNHSSDGGSMTSGDGTGALSMLYRFCCEVIDILTCFGTK